jgi:hypothetical protein
MTCPMHTVYARIENEIRKGNCILDKTPGITNNTNKYKAGVYTLFII